MSEAKAAWIGRVLGFAFPDAGGGTGRGVAYKKLLLRWREAQQTLHSNLEMVGKILLARPEIQTDPRLEDIEEVVFEFPSWIPAFGGELEDILDAGMNAEEPGEQKRSAAKAVVAIDAYRQRLEGASQLIELEEFSATDLHTALPLHAALDQALLDLRQQLGS